MDINLLKMEKGKTREKLITELTAEAASLKALEDKLREARQSIETHLKILSHQKTIEETIINQGQSIPLKGVLPKRPKFRTQ